MNSLCDCANYLAENWWFYVVHAAWQAALLGLVLWSVVTLARRWPSPLRHGLLLLALIKFAIPPLVALPSGLFSQFCPAVTEHAVTASPEPASTLPDQASGEVGVDRALKTSRADAGIATDAIRGPRFQWSEHATAAPSSQENAAVAVAVERVPVSDSRSPWPMLSAKAWTMLVYLAGVLAMACVTAVRYLRLLRLARGAELVTKGPLHRQFQLLARRMGLRKAPRLLLLNDGHQPFSFARLRASVFLSRSLVDQLAADELNTTLAHEFAFSPR